MFRRPFRKSTQDFVDLVLVLARGKHTERRRCPTHMVAADFCQRRNLPPLSELDCQDPVIEVISSRHFLHHIRTLVAHREPGPQHHIKSGGAKIIGNDDVPRGMMIHPLSEASHGLAINSVEQLGILLKPILPQMRDDQRFAQIHPTLILLQFLTELIPPDIRSPCSQHDSGGGSSISQCPEHGRQLAATGLFGVVHHHQQLGGQFYEGGEFLGSNLGRRRQESRAPADRGQVVAQLRGQARLPRTSDPRHHGNCHVRTATGPSIILGGVFLTDYPRRSHRPSAQISEFTTIVKGHHSISGPDELQGRVITRQRSVGGSQHPFDTHHCGQVGIVGPPTAQAADVDAQVPFPVPDVVGTLGKGSVPLPSRPSRGRAHLLDIDR